MLDISVIVPCFNQAQHLNQCLQSVLNQTHQNWECIIINDGSPDDTAEIAKKWIAEDSRFRYYEKKNGGVCSAKNFGIERARGEWILPLDADNYINLEYLSDASKHFKENFKIIYGNARKFGTVENTWIFPKYSREKMAVFNIIDNCAFYKREDHSRVGGYDENMVHGLEDWEFWISLLKNGGNVKHLPGIYLNYRVKNKSRQTDMDSKKIEEMIKYIESKHIAFYHDTFGTFHNLMQQNLDLQSKLNGRVYRFCTLLANLFRKT